MTKKFFNIFLIFFLLLTTTGCQLSSHGDDPREEITLKYWRVFDGRDAFSEIIERFNERHPNITIEYRKIRYEDYRDELLNAMAEDRGPDIFTIHNTWVREYKNRIDTMPESLKISRMVETGTIKKERELVVDTVSTMSLRELRNNFVDVVYDDVVIKNEYEEEEVYGLPLSVDTLAMYYNRDLLNNAGIVSPPKYWDREFQRSVAELTKQDSRGNIVQSGIAMGGSDNIERSVDILSILMMQNGSEMMNERGSVLFAESPGGSRGYNPGLEALRFYTDFANPAKEVYCWNDNLDDSIKLFTEGKLAMMFGYSYHVPEIKSTAPNLRFDVTSLPQISESSRQINHANYWVEVVSHKSDHKDAAWNFLLFATQEEQAKTYLDRTKKPTALKSLIEEQREDEDLEVFADQLLTARSWYQGYDSSAMEEVMREMIDDARNNPQEIEDAITRGASRVGQTTRR